MANPRDPVPAASPAVAANPNFPNIVAPDPNNPVIAQQAVRVGEHEKLLASIENKGKPAGAPEAVDFGEPHPARPMGTAKDAKDFIDRENIRTEEQAEREEANRPRNAQQAADAEAKAKAEQKAKAEADAKSRANQTTHKK